MSVSCIDVLGLALRHLVNLSVRQIPQIIRSLHQGQQKRFDEILLQQKDDWGGPESNAN